MELLIVCKRVKQLVDIGWGVSAMALEIQVSLHKVTTLSRSPHTPCRGFHDEHLPIAATASPHIHTMRTPPFRSGICLRFAFQILLALGAQTPWAAPVAVHGDAGGGVLYEQNFVQTEHSAQTSFMPYLYLDYGALYARVDTFGLKMVPMGAGHLELSLRLSTEGFTSASPGVETRANPTPLGLGTFQETPYGAFMLYGFYDPVSTGSLLEATYAAQFDVGKLSVFPQVGVEKRSQNYLQHLYGVSDAESARSGVAAYRVGGDSTVPVLGVALEYPLTAQLPVSLQVRRKWLDSPITNSPLVTRSTADSVLLSVSYRFR